MTRYPTLDDIRSLDHALAPGLAPWNPGDCWILVERETVYISLRIRVTESELLNDHTVMPVGRLDSSMWPISQTIRGGFIDATQVRFDWSAVHGGLKVVGSDGGLAGAKQVSLDFTARRADA